MIQLLYGLTALAPCGRYIKPDTANVFNQLSTWPCHLFRYEFPPANRQSVGAVMYHERALHTMTALTPLLFHTGKGLKKSYS